jgi:hypothetical protein
LDPKTFLEKIKFKYSFSEYVVGGVLPNKPL